MEMKKSLVVLGVSVAMLTACSNAVEQVASASSAKEQGTQKATITATATSTNVVEQKGTKLIYPDIADTTHASNKVVDRFKAFFNAKSSANVQGTMKFFSSKSQYHDAILGWPLTSYDAIKAMFQEYMPKWGNGRSYPTKIVGDEHSAMVFFTDTPELFGAEIRIMGSVTFSDDGKITRWVDYWDGNPWPKELLEKNQVPPDQYPTDLGESIKQNASKKIENISKQLNAALSQNNAEAAASLFAYDGVVEDMTLRTQIKGSAAIKRFFQRATASLPYGANAKIRYVVGGDQGGGYEWGNANSSVPRGSTAIELNKEGKITAMTVLWDGSLMNDDALNKLVVMTIDNN